MKPIAVVALGGHAILPKAEQPSIGSQFRHTREAMRQVLQLLRRGWEVVITHGNGPQVGHILIRAEAAEGQAYALPLSVAVAESEGEVGYVIQQSLYNELAAAELSRPIVTVLTQVLVDPQDPAFSHPTKPIGPYLEEEPARRLQASGVPLSYFPNHGWRRVVASPRPLRIIEGETVKRLAEQEVIVIAAGGGGIPVIQVQGRLEGVDAVIDKDLASAILAEGIGADLLLLLTDVAQVSLNYQQPDQVDLNSLSLDQAEQYLAAGHFPEGSMGPKVEGAVQFVRATQGKAIITTPDTLVPALEGETGTRITLE
ncbi:MAG: carbamate kinase [Dehalococcoidia bacterium]